ncbi:MAG: hypothetical protein LC793_17825 [Thermomicrobia bacterium]|nr:hypothetical protein [Thermomicrobia bacterium]
MAEPETCMHGHSRREIIKGALKATAYAAPAILGATLVRTNVAAATPPAGVPPPGTLSVRQIPPDAICEGGGLPPPVAMPIEVVATLVGAIPNTTFVVYVTPTAFIPPAPAPGTFTQVGSLTTNAAGSGSLDNTVSVSIPSEKIASITVNFTRVGDPPQNAIYTKTLMPQTFCD